MSLRTVLAALLPALGLACSASPTGSKKSSEQTFTVFVTTELRGTIEPCGCNSDPLGDIARTAELVSSVRRSGRPAIVVDGGSLLYTETSIPEHLAAQEALKSDLIHEIYTNTLRAAAIGLGPNDLGAGPRAVRPPRQAANLGADSGIAVEAPRVVEVGTARVGVFGVVSPAAMEPLGISTTDPEAAAREAVASLGKQGAHLVIGLAHMTHPEAARLARNVPGIDFLVVGQNAPEPPQIKSGPTQVGDTYLLAPANRGQVVTRLDITLRGSGQRPLVDAIGEARAAEEIEGLGERIAQLEADLAQWKDDPSAEAAFVAAKERELAEMRQRRELLQVSPRQAPDRGNFFTMAQVRIRRALACDPEIQTAKQAFDQAAGQANVSAAMSQKPPEPAPGTAGYVGGEQCADCHGEAAEFWEKSRHAGAWGTLERLGKSLDYECISCHVTGWDRPGGANLAYNEHLRSVQCETCHGPGSLHVAGDGDPDVIMRAPPESLCVTCHNAEHSDTFQYKAYLRDVTGPGHAEDLRKALGDGPTGHQLRSEALDKAGREVGANCLK